MTVTNPRWARHYESLEDFLAVMDGKEKELRELRSSAITGSKDFTGTEDFASAVTIARHGWPEGARRVRDIAGGLQHNLEAHIVKQASYYDIEGADVNVGRYLDGNPDCMINFRKAERTGSPVVTISVNASLGGGHGTDIIEARGAAIAALVDLMEMAGVRVELWAGSLTQGRSKTDTYAQRVCIKQANDALDIDRVAFCLAHPSFLRRLSFAERDLCSDDTQRKAMGYGKFDGGYGMAIEIIDPDMQLHVPSYNNDSRNWKHSDAAKNWIIEQLKKFNCYQD